METLFLFCTSMNYLINFNFFFEAFISWFLIRNNDNIWMNNRKWEIWWVLLLLLLLSSLLVVKEFNLFLLSLVPGARRLALHAASQILCLFFVISSKMDSKRLFFWLVSPSTRLLIRLKSYNFVEQETLYNPQWRSTDETKKDQRKITFSVLSNTLKTEFSLDLLDL